MPCSQQTGSAHSTPAVLEGKGMASHQRKMRRQHEKGLAREQKRQNQRLAEIEAKWLRVQLTMREHWKARINECVPQWQARLANRIPPRAYVDWARRVVLNCPPDGYYKRLAKRQWPRWRVWVNSIVPQVGRRVLSAVLMEWLLCVRRTARVFGTRTKTVIEGRRARMRIWHWFRCVYDWTYEI